MHMHPIQQAILDLAKSKNLLNMSFREIGRMVTGREQSPQKIKYHMDCLIRDGYLVEDHDKEVLVPAKLHQKYAGFATIPILGSASCGPATKLAEENIEGYLRLSEKFLPRNHMGLFIINAVGQSMNRAKVNGTKSIDDGDFVLVDGKARNPEPNSYVLAVTDGVANVKKYSRSDDGQIALVSESTEEFSPIYIHPEDNPEFFINGKVLDVFKKPCFNE
jgi:SOS-response transcriptional repressor LexA